MMKKICTLLFPIFLCSPLFAQWTYSGNAFLGTVRGTFFMSADTGFAVGSTGSIAKTVDGGINWDLQAPGTGLLRGITFVDHDTGYVCGQNGQIFKTTNSGTTWIQVYDGGSNYFRALDFVNASTGYVAGPTGRVFKTTDYGHNWSYYQLSITDADVIQIDMINETTGYLVCSDGAYEHGYIYKTTDGGESWSQVFSDATLGLLALAVVDENVVYAGGNMQTIIKTVDGGSNWDTVYAGDSPEAVYRGADVRNTDGVIMVDDFGNVIETANEGTDWINELVGSGGLFCVHFPNANRGYAGDLDGNIYSAIYNCELPGTPGAISGSNNICSGTEVIYWINSIPNADTYSWTVPGGSVVISGQGDTMITVLVGDTSGIISVTAVNSSCGSGGTSSMALNVNVPPQAMPVAGAEAVCQGSEMIYTTISANGATDYEWTVPAGATILSGQGDTSIVVLFGANSGEVMVTPSNECGAGSSASVNVTVIPIPVTAEVNGINTVCAEAVSSYSTTEVPSADSYEWAVPADAIILSGQGTASVLVQFGAMSGDVTVTAVNSICGSGNAISFPVTVNTVPVTADEISGNTEGCSGDTMMFTIQSIPNADTYTWVVPNSSEIISGQGSTSITAIMATGAGNVSVYASNECGDGDGVSLAIDIHPTPSPVITQVNDTLYSSSPLGNQWYYNNEAIGGATEDSYAATQNGFYFVIVTSAFGCSASSDTVEVIGVGVEHAASDVLTDVYPNPSGGITVIQLAATRNGTIVITDVQGRKIYEQKIDAQKNLIDVSGFAKGICVVKILSVDGQLLGMKKLVVQ